MGEGADMPLLNRTSAPPLPPSPPVPNKTHIDSVLNILRLYFSRVDTLFGALVNRLGGRFLEFPNGSFYSTTTQSIAVINTPTLVTLGSTGDANGIRYVLGDGLHVDYNGLYNVQFSIQLTNSDTQAHDMAVWLRVNGSDVPWSSSVVTVPSTHGGQPGYQIIAANFYVELLQSDYLELWWSSNSLQVQINALPPITTPFVNPGSPAVVVTVSFVSTTAN